MSSLYILLIIISYIIMMKFFKDKNTDIISIVFGLVSIVLMFVKDMNTWTIIQTPEFINYLLVAILIMCGLKSLYRVVNTIEQDTNYIYYLVAFLVASINFKYLSLFVLIYLASSIYLKRNESTTLVDSKLTLLLLFVFLSLTEIQSNILNLSLMGFLILIQICFILRPINVLDKVLIFLLSVFTCYQHEYSVYQSILIFIIPIILIILDNIDIPLIRKLKEDIAKFGIIERIYIKFKTSVKHNYILNYNQQKYDQSTLKQSSISFVDKRSDSILVAIFSLIFITLIILTSWGV